MLYHLAPGKSIMRDEAPCQIINAEALFKGSKWGQFPLIVPTERNTKILKANQSMCPK
ncbi:hypothetical protein AWH56_006065 [Anaerobacillus isosaccharinicus]|uniref:Uncharacterized protein n=1 Tax=Anaerobacillus isosaccharinicus TaxID=1532552 RepID=A0A7S7LA83_9BACI|nr:hypothetical protein [Anaerobacillus isosaccharinicus]MBA5584412.1 hypothetical protein [Anaerobacillus isosaccharinicus]QOY37197.1 hypothetical protein AWH56_006065 [Anaerobacillus isosaccharinicus]